PFAIAGQLFNPLLIDSDAAERAAMLDGAAALAAPVLGLAPPGPSADPIDAALRGLHRLCANLVERGPLMLAVDDAHWADEASLRFMSYLARRLEGLRVLV